MDMMHMTDKFNYGQTSEFHVLGIPYAGNDLNMFVFLPRERNTLSKHLALIGGEQLVEMMEQTSNIKVQVNFLSF